MSRLIHLMVVPLLYLMIELALAMVVALLSLSLVVVVVAMEVWQCDCPSSKIYNH